MTREQQAAQMHQRILQAAMEEFAAFDYAQASLNHICQRANISKGIIYHYFQDKDALYLACVQRCFARLYQVYEGRELETLPLSQSIAQFMQLRMTFFQENPLERGVFFHALFQTPPHLKGQVMQSKEQLNGLFTGFFQAQLSKISLRPGVTMEQAVAFLTLQSSAINESFCSQPQEEQSFEELIAQHEVMVAQWLDITLYGMIQQEG